MGNFFFGGWGGEGKATSFEAADQAGEEAAANASLVTLGGSLPQVTSCCRVVTLVEFVQMIGEPEGTGTQLRRCGRWVTPGLGTLGWQLC